MLGDVLIIILLSAEFFIPMRLLGSFFHVAMNGISASERMFKLLDTPVEEIKYLDEEQMNKLNNINIELKMLTLAMTKKEKS